MVMQAMNESIQAIREVLAIPRLAIWRTIPEIVFEGIAHRSLSLCACARERVEIVQNRLITISHNTHRCGTGYSLHGDLARMVQSTEPRAAGRLSWKGSIRIIACYFSFFF
jgi:hypothetical protein